MSLRHVRAPLSAAVLAGAAAYAFVAGDAVALLVLAIAGPPLAIAVYRRSIEPSLEAGRLALIDQLTGLGNDRQFLERLERDLDRAELERGGLALCLLDVDDFKQVNDRYGHPAGDAVLAEVASHLRRGGEAFRLGGDEFALLLPGSGEQEGRAIAESVVERIAAAEHAHGATVTASAGIAVFGFGDEGVERGALVRAADDALYRAKRAGKNCVRCYEPGLAAPAEQAAATLSRAARARGLEASAAGELAARVAARLGLPPAQIEQVRVGAMLNDIGKLALSDELLSKPGPLTPEERSTVERHPSIGHQILDSLGAEPVATWVLHHHERWDGQGYPERLSGERIPLGARILFAADAFEAMTTDQPWRERLTPAEALAELERCAGTQFDPRVVAALRAELRARSLDGLPAAV